MKNGLVPVQAQGAAKSVMARFEDALRKAGFHVFARHRSPLKMMI